MIGYLRSAILAGAVALLVGGLSFGAAEAVAAPDDDRAAKKHAHNDDDKKAGDRRGDAHKRDGRHKRGRMGWFGHGGREHGDRKDRHHRDNQRDGHGRGDRGERPDPVELAMKHLFDGIDLYDEQEADIRELIRSKHEKLRDKMREGFKKARELREKIEEAREARDHEKLSKLHGKMAELKDRGSLREHHREVARAIKQKLTDEQQEQFDANIERIKERMKASRQRWQERSEAGKDHDRKHKDRRDGAR